MNILIAPDSFKGSNSSHRVGESIKKGVLKVFPESNITNISIADGGEGTVDAILQNSIGEMIIENVTGPSGKTVKASYALMNDGTAIIEMASASGLTLVDEKERDVLSATSRGTGELIISALNRNCRKIVIGLGGSATTDGGVGMAQALGYKFLDDSRNEIGSGGGELLKLSSVDSSDIDRRIFQTEIIAACDVTNPLYGKSGAAFIYAPQKGADENDVEILDRGLSHLDTVVGKDLKSDRAHIPGAGAAGGLGFGIISFCDGKIQSGISTVLDAVNFDSLLEKTDLVITGEGKIDGQSIYGKVPVGIAEKAGKYDIPVLVIAGDIGDGIDQIYKTGIDSVMSSVNRAMPLSEAMSKSSELLEDAAERAMRMIRIGMKIRN